MVVGPKFRVGDKVRFNGTHQGVIVDCFIESQGNKGPVYRYHIQARVLWAVREDWVRPRLG